MVVSARWVVVFPFEVSSHKESWSWGLWLVVYVSLVSMKYLVFVPLVQLSLLLRFVWLSFIMFGFLHKKEVPKLDGTSLSWTLLLMTTFVIVLLSLW